MHSLSYNQRKLPALSLCLPFIIGIAYQRLFQISTDLTSIYIIVFTLLALVLIDHYKRRKLSSILCLILLFLLGFTRSDLKENYLPDNHFAIGQQNAIGIIQENIVERKKYRTSLKVKYLETTDGYVKSSGNLLCYFDKDSLSQQLSPGDVIYFSSDIQATRANNNPLAFDFKNYLHNRGLNHQSFIRSENWLLLKSGELSFLKKFSLDLRNDLLDILRKYIKQPDEQAIAAALILGYRNQLTSEIYDAYTETGSVHVLAVSGLHLGIVTKFIMVILGLIRWDNKLVKILKAVCTIAFIWLFALVTGAAPAVIRAATMFTFITISLSFRANIYNVLAASAIALLMYDPFLLFQASFQFSYMALLSILYFHPIISSWWIPENKLIHGLWNLAVVAIAAQVLVFPVTIYYFHKFPLYFILSGIIAVPAAFLIVNGALFLFLAEVCCSPLNAILGPLLECLIEWFLWSIMTIQKLPFCSIENILIRTPDMILIYIALAAMMIGISWKKKKMILVMLIIGIVYITSSCFYYYQNLKQKELIVYDLNNTVAIDIMSGTHLYEIVSEEISEQTKSFTNDNYRLSKKINTVQSINPMDSLVSDGLLCHKGYLSYRNHHLLVLDNKTALPKVGEIHVDYLIIGKVSTSKLSYALKHICPENIILTNANKFWEIDRYKEILKNHKYHYVGDDGAYITSL